MRRQIVSVLCSAILGCVASSSIAVAQQKTVKACQEEWRANRAANQASGITEKAYVAQCRANGAPAVVPAAPAAPPAAAAPAARQAQAAAGRKTAKACREEWQANKTANQAAGVTERAYVDQCRAGGASTQPTAAPAPPPAPTASQAAPAPATPPAGQLPAPTTTARPPPAIPASPAGANQFATEGQAKARCPTDTVVWVTLSSGIYHFAGTRYYGTTKKGAYMCERDSAAAGMRAAKNETHP